MLKNNFFGALALCAVFGFVFSCTPQQSELTVDNLKQEAQVVGKVTYDSGYLWEGGMIVSYSNWLPASDVEVIARIPYSNIGGSSAKGDYTVTTKTDANGKYSIKIPVGATGVNVSLSALPFYKDKHVLNGEGKDATVSGALYNNSTNPGVYVQSGEIKTANITVTSNAVFGD